jgi:DNA-binding NarL/FixJ family response regulator
MYKILLIESNLIYRNVLKSALLKKFIGLETEEVSDESEALNAVKIFKPGLVIMDIHLSSGFTGLDLAKIIKTEHPDIVVMILTQLDAHEYYAVAQENGADLFFSKSDSLDNIINYVASAIEYKPKLVAQ